MRMLEIVICIGRRVVSACTLHQLTRLRLLSFVEYTEFSQSSTCVSTLHLHLFSAAQVEFVP